MSWEETINHIRSRNEYTTLVEQAYLEQDLSLNVKRFSESEEFKETLKIIKQFFSGEKIEILDVGCGNGVSSIAFALSGFVVTAIDPDPSDSVGTGAVQKLKEEYGLNSLSVYTETAEEFKTDKYFDIVYCRQAMHHANNLSIFVQNTSRFLRDGGLFFTVRDHVIFDAEDKKRFLREHPLHKFYLGENAFTPIEYKRAFSDAGLTTIKEFKYYDSVINFFPQTAFDLNEKIESEKNLILKNLKNRLGWLGTLPFVYWSYKKLKFDPEYFRNEASVAGRMYSYISLKK